MDLITTHRDFPRKGVDFKDVSPILADPSALKGLIKDLELRTHDLDFDVIAGLESRGFLFGVLLAQTCHVPFIMIRKSGKLPGKVFKEQYELEYGNATFEVSEDALKVGQRVLIVDDLLATGGSAKAAHALVRKCQAEVAAFLFLTKIESCDGERMLRNLEPNAKIICCDDVAAQPTQEWEVSNSRGIVVLYYPTMRDIAYQLATLAGFELMEVAWNYFPDGCPNITFPSFERLQGRDVVYLGSLSSLDNFVVQQSLIIALSRQLVKRLHIVWPYFSTATMERVDREGTLAVAEPVAKLMSSVPQLCPATLTIFDIHALQERFYFQDTVTVRLATNLTPFMRLVDMRWQGQVVIVFPDDGAHKRFKQYIPNNYSIMVATKIRGEGSERKIVIGHRDMRGTESLENVLIIDDLVQSGGTLNHCKDALKALGARNISAYCTHAVFPNRGYRKFLPGREYAGFDSFYVSDSIPENTTRLQHLKPFEVLPLAPALVSLLGDPDVPRAKCSVYIASTSDIKLQGVKYAVETSFPHLDCIFTQIDTTARCEASPAQPLGLDSTIQAARRRLEAARDCADLAGRGQSGKRFYVSIESGIVDKHDVTFIIVRDILTNREASSVSEYTVPVDAELFDRYMTERGASDTYGDFVTKETHTIKHDDWQLSATGRSRAWYISQHFRTLLKELYT